MAERDPRHDDVIEFDFGDEPPKSPSAPVPPIEDDPLAALATELATSLDEDELRRRQRAAAEQRRLAGERAGEIAPETLDAERLEIELRADLLEAETSIETGPRFVDVRVGGRVGVAPRRNPIRAALSLVGRTLSTGDDPANLPRLLAGYLARTVAAGLVVALAVSLFAGKAGSAFDLRYEPAAALVRHTTGLATQPIADDESDASGMVNCDPATGVALQASARAMLDAFDAAVASGDTAPLTARFASPDAAAEWVADAAALHAEGARRAYWPDPRESGGICFTSEGSDGLAIRFGGLTRYDLGPADAVLRSADAAGLVVSFVYRTSQWELDSARFLAP
jgi:hypothetical protein